LNRGRTFKRNILDVDERVAATVATQIPDRAKGKPIEI
jgi:hypothetical protein